MYGRCRSDGGPRGCGLLPVAHDPPDPARPEGLAVFVSAPVLVGGWPQSLQWSSASGMEILRAAIIVTGCSGAFRDELDECRRQQHMAQCFSPESCSSGCRQGLISLICAPSKDHWKCRGVRVRAGGNGEFSSVYFMLPKDENRDLKKVTCITKSYFLHFRGIVGNGLLTDYFMSVCRVFWIRLRLK